MASLTNMRRDEVDPDREADLARLVDSRLARVWRPIVLLLAGAGVGGGAATLATPLGAAPVTVPASSPVVCECSSKREPTVTECRLAADYMREAARAAGVDESTLEAVASEVLGTPPAPESMTPGR